MTQQEKHLEGSRRRLEEKALRYARFKLFGNEIDNTTGNVVRYTAADLKTHTEYSLLELGRAAEGLLMELAATPLPERAKEPRP